MKTAFIVVLIAAVALAAPVEESAKTKRGLSLGLGYHHAPIVTHSHYVAPVVHSTYVHHAPLIAHAPIIHHPIAYHAIPTYHSLHHW